ncbi:MAG TPA: hypothetical protein VMR43_16595 [Variovorax sp.]|nr:hypothetical protein [Variovorax sp.]
MQNEDGASEHGIRIFLCDAVRASSCRFEDATKAWRAFAEQRAGVHGAIERPRVASATGGAGPVTPATLPSERPAL